MAGEDNSKSSFFQRLKALPFGIQNGLAQILIFIEMQGINTFKTIKFNYKVPFERLAAIAGPLSKASIVFAGITVVIENILNFKRIWEMPDDIDEVQKNKTYLDTFLGVLKAVAVGIFTAVTFGVAGALIVAAGLALPVLMAIDCIFDVGKIAYDRHALKRKQERKDPEFQGEEGQIRLKAAKDNLSNAESILLAKAGILGAAIMTLFPPIAIVGYSLIAVGFGVLVKKVIDGQEIEAKKEQALQDLKKSKEEAGVINGGGESISARPNSSAEHVVSGLQPSQEVTVQESQRDQSSIASSSSSQPEQGFSPWNCFAAFFSHVEETISSLNIRNVEKTPRNRI